MSRLPTPDPELQIVLIAYPATVDGWLEYISSDKTLARRMLLLIMRKQPRLLRPT